MARFQIRCINKTDRYNPYERITHIGGLHPDGSRWRITQQEAVGHIITSAHQFFVVVNGDQVEVIIRKSRFGNWYLTTEPDGDEPNNLLSLPECPA